jgi:hypothetical protein
MAGRDGLDRRGSGQVVSRAKSRRRQPGCADQHGADARLERGVYTPVELSHAR